MASLWGHWRDSAGAQLPTTSWAAVSFATQVRNDSGSNLTKPNDSTFQVGEALGSGHAKIFIANVRFKQDRNNRGTAQARFVLSSGTGNLFTTYATSYTRNDANDEGWIRVFGVLTGNSLDAQVQLQWRSDTDAITRTVDGGTVVNASDVQVADIWFDAIGMYTDTTGNQTLGGTTRNTVALNNNVQQTNTAAIERSGNVVTMKGDNKKYLILGSIAGDAGGSRTQRNGVLAYDGTADVATESYCYQRNAGNEYAGMVLHDLYETATTDVTVEMQCYRGAGIAADQGGADVDGSWNTTPGFPGLCVIELSDDAEGFRSHDSVGLQTISGVANVTLNAMRDQDFADAGSYDGRTNTSIDVNGAHNALLMSSIWTARNNIASGTRGTMGARIEINGVDQTVGEHGNYSRGNQGSQDTFAWAANPGAIFALSDNDTIEVETFDAGDNGGTDRTQAGTVSFWSLNLDTTEPAASGATATLDQTMGAMTVSSTAEVAVDATLDQTTGAVTLDSDAEVALVATLDQTMDAVTLDSDAQIGAPITATLDQTMGAVTLDSDTEVLVDGVLTVTLDDITLSSTATVSFPTITATLDQTLGSVTLLSQGEVLVDATLDQTLGEITLDSDGTVTDADLVASLDATLGEVTLSSEAIVRTTFKPRRITGGGGRPPMLDKEEYVREPSAPYLLAQAEKADEEAILLALL